MFCPICFVLLYQSQYSFQFTDENLFKGFKLVKTLCKWGTYPYEYEYITNWVTCEEIHSTSQDCNYNSLHNTSGRSKILFNKTNLWNLYSIIKKLLNYLSMSTFSSLCFCGDKPPAPAMRADEQDCNYTCSGDEGFNCGGDWRNSVYKSGNSGTNWKITNSFSKIYLFLCYKIW